MEIFTLLTGVLYVILEIRQKDLMWVVGIITSIAAMSVFFRQGLYASFVLNLYYLLTSVIGLWQWSKDHKKAHESSLAQENRTSVQDVIHLNRLNITTVIVSLVIVAAGTYGLAYVMTLLENPMSWLDSFIAVLSAVATWWLVRSYLQQWILWGIANTATVMLCLSQGLWWMAALYVAYVVSSAIGYVHWKKNGVII